MDMPSRHVHAKHTHPQAHHHPPEAPESDSLKDPVCDMTVTARSEHHVEHAGRPYYFYGSKDRRPSCTGQRPVLGQIADLDRVSAECTFMAECEQ